MGPRIVVLGGGFGGAYAARALERTLRGRDADILLVDRNNYFIFYPLLVEAGTDALEPRHTVVAQRSFLKRARFLMADVVALDEERRQVRVVAAGTEGERRLDYDHLVVSVGSVTRRPPVPGLEEHALEIKTVADAIALKDRAIRMLEIADGLDDERERRRLLHFVVVGGSFTGTELAGEYHAFLRKAARRYPHVSPRECNVTLVEMQARILPALDEKLAEYAEQSLRKRGVDILLERRIARIGPDHVLLDDGRRVEAATTIWCAGVAPNPVVAKLGLPTTDGGWVRGRPDLRAEGRDRVWAIGDCAANPDPEGTPYPATAQHATRMAEHLALNIRRALDGEATEPCRIRSQGTLAPLGCRAAVAQVLGVPISGFFAWILFRTVYLFKMPGWIRRARILVDWNLNLFLPPDLVSFGFGRIRASGGSRR